MGTKTSRTGTTTQSVDNKGGYLENIHHNDMVAINLAGAVDSSMNDLVRLFEKSWDERKILIERCCVFRNGVKISIDASNIITP